MTLRLPRGPQPPLANPRPLEPHRDERESCPVVILCGGQGSRMADVTRDLPKPLLPIGGMPIVWHIMKIYSRQGFTDFILCLGHLGQQIERFFTEPLLTEADGGLGFRPSLPSERWEPHWRIVFAYTGEDTPTGGRIKQIEDMIHGNEFMVTYGDGLADIDLGALLELHRGRGRIATVTGVRTNSPFGALESEDGIVTAFVEKPALPQRINGGFFVMNRAAFEYIGSGEMLEDGPLHRLVADGQLSVYEHNGYWRCMDTRKDFEALNALWEEGRVPWKTW